MTDTPEYKYSEKPAIQLFKKLGYAYLNGNTDDERESINEIILSQRLKDSLKRINPWMTPESVTKAYQQLSSTTGTSLMEINQKIWTLIRGGSWAIKQVLNGREDFHQVTFIDFIHPENNDFLVRNQLAIFF